MSVEDKVKFNKVGKQISESEHQATHNALNTPKRKQAEVTKPYQGFTTSIVTPQQSKSTQKQEPNKPHQGYASSIETPEVPPPNKAYFNQTSTSRCKKLKCC